MAAANLHIYCCRIADVDSTQLARYEILLDADERRRLALFQVAEIRNEFLISRALLRTALAVHLHTESHALQFVRNADGKPQLAPPFANWHFNLSHSSAWVALAISSVGPVGIDIESHARKNNLAAIAGRFFSAAENASLQQLVDLGAVGAPSGTAWLRRFFAIWTLKEAHAKALGCGLGKILSCSSFVPSADFLAVEENSAAPRTAAIELQLSGAAASAVPVATWLYRPDPATSLAVSQLGELPAAIALYRWAPESLKTYFERSPIAAGSWLPAAASGCSTVAGTHTDKPRA
jgi:4'-phosphopantetheinyl transferase